jgi:hypothetical protein
VSTARLNNCAGSNRHPLVRQAVQISKVQCSQTDGSKASTKTKAAISITWLMTSLLTKYNVILTNLVTLRNSSSRAVAKDKAVARGLNSSALASWAAQ